MRFFWLALVSCVLPGVASAHGGGLNADGCHHDRKSGSYHCHRGPSAGANPATAATSPPPPAAQPAAKALPPGCFVGPRGGTYTITKSGRKNYSGC